jgi:signal recognition particle receptor subunit beta
MVVLNYSGEELNAKIVYYGPGVSGKTTNLEHIHSKLPIHAKGKMVSMKTRTDRTLFFDFLPLEFGEIGGYRTRFLLYTVPGQVYYNATRKLVLKGADAVVFVADSSRSKLQENVESLRNLEENLNELGMSLDSIPWVIQYNKRDVADAMTVPELTEHLNLLEVPAFEATAIAGPGVYETFHGIAGILYQTLRQKLESGDIVPRDEETPDDPLSPTDVDPLADAVDSALREVGPAAAIGKTPPPAPAPKPAAAPVSASEPPPKPSTKSAATVAPEAAIPEFQTSTEANKVYDVSAEATRDRTAKAIEAVRDAADSEEELSRVPGAGSSVSSTAAKPAPSAPDKSPVSKAATKKNEMDVGRTLELDESPAEATTSPAPEPDGFITDPMGAVATESTPAALEPKFEPTDVEKDIDMDVDIVSEIEVNVPVVISRSQVRKALPVKLILEIQIVED